VGFYFEAKSGGEVRIVGFYNNKQTNKQTKLYSQKSLIAVQGGHIPRRQGGGAAKVTLRCHIGVFKTHRDKLPTSHLLLMERQFSSITHIRMQVVWARRNQILSTCKPHLTVRGVRRKGLQVDDAAGDNDLVDEAGYRWMRQQGSMTLVTFRGAR